MSHVNGNDIDDLFRRASDKYPLRTDSGDWDRLAADLEKDPSLILPPLGDEGDRRRRKRFFWLFLLLPLGSVGYYIVHPGRTSGSSVDGVHSTMSTRTSSNTVSTTTTTASPATTPTKPTAATTTAASTATTPADGRIPGGATASAGTTASTGATASTRTTDLPETNGLTGTNASGGTTAMQTPGGTGRHTIGTHTPDGADGYGGTGGTELVDANTRTGTSGTQPAARDPHPAGFLTQRAPTTGGVNLHVNVQARSTGNKDVANSSSAAKKTTLQTPRQSSFYAGLMAAPDLSTVKFQSVKGVGTTFSLLLGYNINRRWAIETGVSLDRKKYYTQGEYFSTKHLNLYPTTSIQNVDGICNMWEIPLNLRYNLSEGTRTKWFATAGLSTYFMSKEQYAYQLKNMNTGYVWNAAHTYDSASHYPFAVINLSIGYEQKLGKVGNLRIEPYLRVPLSGIGTGSLPIMSAGLNIGITRRIW